MDPSFNFPAESSWGLDPLFWAYSQWHIHDVLAMLKHPIYSEISFYKSIEGPLRPIMKLQIKGIITRVDHKPKLILYTIDDGTGVINCVHWLPRHSSAEESVAPILTCAQKFELGSFVSVLGRISHWQDDKQVTIHEIALDTSDHAESIWHFSTLELKRNAYDHPPVSVQAYKS